MRKCGYKYEKIDSYINNCQIEYKRKPNIHRNQKIGCRIYDHWSLKSSIFCETVICYPLFITLIKYTNTYYGLGKSNFIIICSTILNFYITTFILFWLLFICVYFILYNHVFSALNVSIYALA